MKKDFIEILYENRKKAVIISVIIIFLIIFFIYFNRNQNLNPESPYVEAEINLKLFGKEEIVLEFGEEYQEPGYYAVDTNGIIKTSFVKVRDNININKPGTYTVSYQIANILKKRIVIVKEEPKSESISLLNISLEGDKVITLSIGEEYQEPGFKALSKTGEDITNQVEVMGEVNTNKEGTYTLTYQIQDEGVTKEIIRTVIVLNDNLNISITPDKTGYTNTSINLKIEVKGTTFESLVLPNKVVVNKETATYQVDNNGTYTIYAYNQNGKEFSKSITIGTIDKIAPNGVCSALIDENAKTNIQVTANDDFSGIKKYYYYDSTKLLLTSENKVYTYNGKTSSDVYVRIYDNAGNYKHLKCSFKDNSIQDRSKNKMILIGDSRTEDMCKTSYCNACQGDKVFAKVSMGYSWLINTAIPNTNNYLKNNSNESYNIFILLGVNGIGSSSSSGKSVSNKYYNTVKELANTTWKNHYIYYVSVNPVVNSSGTKNAIKSFNSNMKDLIVESNLKNLKYCDTYSKLSITSSNSPDGVHYNCTTYRKIRSLLDDCL